MFDFGRPILGGMQLCVKLARVGRRSESFQRSESWVTGVVGAMQHDDDGEWCFCFYF